MWLFVNRILIHLVLFRFLFALSHFFFVFLINSKFGLGLVFLSQGYTAVNPSLAPAVLHNSTSKASIFSHFPLGLAWLLFFFWGGGREFARGGDVDRKVYSVCTTVFQLSSEAFYFPFGRFCVAA